MGIFIPTPVAERSGTEGTSSSITILSTQTNAITKNKVFLELLQINMIASSLGVCNCIVLRINRKYKNSLALQTRDQNMGRNKKFIKMLQA